MILLLDNHDSFTYNLQDYFAQIGVKCKIYRNSGDPKEIFMGDYRGIVLSPGPGRPASSGCLMEVLRYYEKTHPILGVCLGHQAIGEYFGAKLEKAEIPMHGKVSKIILDNKDILFEGLQKEINVVRYHSLTLKEIPACLRQTAHTSKGEVMAIKHKTLPIHGLQFHPEAILTEKGIEMLHNWVSFYQLTN